MSATASALPSRRYLAPAQVAEDLGLDVRKVLMWIRTGELRAVNIAVNLSGKKPRWRIAAVDLETFLLRRTAAPVLKPTRRRRADPAITEYF